MSLYECLCGYQTENIGNIKKHLNRKKSCMPGIDMKTINVNDLCVKRIRENLDNLTEEQKNERKSKQSIMSVTKNKMLGKMSIDIFAKKLLTTMINSSKKRNHKISFTIENVINLLNNNSIYIVPNTILGCLEFPMMLTNGYHNSASFDRINDKLGYTEENIEIRPHFLNTLYKLTTNHIRNIVKIREENQDKNELINIIKIFKNFDKTTNFFYRLAATIQLSCLRSKEERNKTFDFKDIKECTLFLIKKYTEQGGRCAYSNVPIYPETNHSYKISPERIDPTKSYNKNNIILIVVGLNSPLSGQYLNKNLSEEEKLIALEAGKFNQDYWILCTKMTTEIIKKCEDVKEQGKKIIFENLSDEIKIKIF